MCLSFVCCAQHEQGTQRATNDERTSVQLAHCSTGHRTVPIPTPAARWPASQHQDMARASRYTEQPTPAAGLPRCERLWLMRLRHQRTPATEAPHEQACSQPRGQLASEHACQPHHATRAGLQASSYGQPACVVPEACHEASQRPRNVYELHSHEQACQPRTGHEACEAGSPATSRPDRRS